MTNIITRRELLKVMNSDSFKETIKNCENRCTLEDFMADTVVSAPRPLDPSNNEDRKTIEELDSLIRKEGRIC